MLSAALMNLNPSVSANRKKVAMELVRATMCANFLAAVPAHSANSRVES